MRNGHRKIVHAAVAAALAAPCVAFGAPDVAAGKHPDVRTVASRVASFNVRGSKLLGMEVRDAAGNEVGELKDVVIDLGTGEARYAAVSHGGILGIGDTLYTVPMHALQLGRDADALVLMLSEVQLRRQRTFHPEDWPRFGDAAYWDSVERTAGAGPGRALRYGYRLTDLLEREAENVLGNELGEVEDVVIDMAHHRVHYIVLEFDPGILQGERLLPLPLQAFHPPESVPDADNETLLLRLTEPDLKRMTGFDEDRWPDFNDRRFLRDLDRQLQPVFGPVDRTALR